MGRPIIEVRAGDLLEEYQRMVFDAAGLIARVEWIYAFYVVDSAIREAVGA